MKLVGTLVWWMAFASSAFIAALGAFAFMHTSGRLAMLVLVGTLIKVTFILISGYVARLFFQRLDK